MSSGGRATTSLIFTLDTLKAAGINTGFNNYLWKTKSRYDISFKSQNLIRLACLVISVRNTFVIGIMPERKRTILAKKKKY